MEVGSNRFQQKVRRKCDWEWIDGKNDSWRNLIEQNLNGISKKIYSFRLLFCSVCPCNPITSSCFPPFQDVFCYDLLSETFIYLLDDIFFARILRSITQMKNSQINVEVYFLFVIFEIRVMFSMEFFECGLICKYKLLADEPRLKLFDSPVCWLFSLSIQKLRKGSIKSQARGKVLSISRFIFCDERIYIFYLVDLKVWRGKEYLSIPLVYLVYFSFSN